MKYEIKVGDGVTIVVVGDIHEHEEQFDKLVDEIKPSEKRLLVSVGDIYDKGFGKNVAESITDKLRKLVEKGHAYVIKGNHELSNIRWNRRNHTMTEQLRWWDNQPLALVFTFPNKLRITVVHGGVLPSYSWDDIASNLDMCYIRHVDENGQKVRRFKKFEDNKCIMVMEKPGKVWHELYDGRFGYIASGHDAQKDGIAKFYKYSCNLDTAVYHTGKLTAQVFESGMKKDLLTFSGTPKYPDLEEMQRLMYKGRI